jgi:dihydroflavonol-4-reductase
VLVTGANGFLGSWLTRELNARQIDVRILCRPTSDLSELKGLKFETSTGDITDAASVEKASLGVDSVFHLAGLIAYTKSERARMESVNVTGTANVIDACVKNRVKRLVHMSSVVAIGASLDGRSPLNEESPFNVAQWNLGYSETKKKAEESVVQAVKNRGLDAVILNPATIYGAGDAKKGSRKTQLKVARGEFPFYTPGGVNIVSSKDVIEAVLNAWKSGQSGRRYILGGENITVKRLFQIIAKVAGVQAPKFYLPKSILLSLGCLGDILEKKGKRTSFNSEAARMATMYHWYDSSRAQKEIGLKVTPAETAIANSVNWMKEQGLLKT